MSGNCKKESKDNEKPVFEPGEFSDRANREAHEEARQARLRDPEQARRRTVEGFEEKWADGYTKVDGRYVPADGRLHEAAPGVATSMRP